MNRALQFYFGSKIFRAIAEKHRHASAHQHHWSRVWRRGLSINYAQSQLSTNIKDDVQATKCVQRDSRLVIGPGCVTIDAPQWTSPLKLSQQWLRDQCQCSLCKDPVTGLRLAVYPQAKVDIISAKYKNNTMTLSWSDGHVSSFHNDWLWNHNLPGTLSNVGLPEKTIWNAEIAKSINFAKLHYEDFMHNEDSVKIFLESVLKYGIGIVQNVPVTSEHTRKVMERNGPIWRTFWGEIYHVVADLKAHTHPSYTGEDLLYHTDTNYYFEASGLQAFHVLEHTGDGANNKFVDGFFVADTIRRKQPEVYDFLSKKPVSSKYCETGKLHLKNEDILFKHHPITKELTQIRYSPYDIDVFRTVEQEDMDLYYHSLHSLAAEIKNESNTHWIQLTPGTVLVTDNWRVLHGRTPFTGKRTLCGMYVSRSDFMSRARRFGLVA